MDPLLFFTLLGSSLECMEGCCKPVFGEQQLPVPQALEEAWMDYCVIPTYYTI